MGGKGIAIIGVLFLFSLRALAVTADFKVKGATAGCAPLLVDFEDASTGGAVKWSWDFGNGNTSDKKNPGAIYNKAGSYTVTLTVEDASGNKDTKKKVDLIVVHGGPTVDFKADKTGGCEPLTVNFTNLTTQGTSSIVTWVWDFGDGTTSSSQNPGSHTYITNNVNKRFDVKLFAKDANGCQMTVTKKSFIAVPKKPVVDFTANTTGACTGPVTVNFTPSVSIFTNGGATYLWDFGDGSSPSSNTAPSHTYSSNGSYTVSLTVTDSAGCANTQMKSGYIKIGKPSANFSYSLSPPSGCSPLMVTFTNTSSPLPGGSTFKWDFGDGKTSTAQDPSHLYTSAGSYKVKMVITAPGGCIDSITKGPISVVTGPIVSFSSADTVGCAAPHTATFTNTSNTGTVIQWTFGDGTTGTGNVVSHKFTKLGTFDVALTVVFSGCTTTVTKVGHVVIQPLVPGFSIIPKSGCLPLSVAVTNTTKTGVPIASWEWDWGDGSSISTGKDPSPHTYTAEGNFDIKLTAKTAGGACTGFWTQSLKVGRRPKADFSATPVSGCIPLKVKFTNLTNNGTVKADSFFWEFGDGLTSVETNPIHVYDVKPGKYTVKLIAKNKGCNDTLIKKDLVTLFAPWARFDIQQTLCEPDTVKITDQAVNYNTIVYDFGDGSPTTSTKNPVHFYKPGQYKLRQIVHNDTTGCTDTFSVSISVDPIIADFTTNDTLGCYPLKVKFKSSLNRPFALFNWDFGDGGTDTVADPVHFYLEKGVYTVRLKITDNSGCTRTIVKKNYVVARGPIPGFSVTPDRGCVPLTVKVKDESTSSYPVVSRIFDMGNGAKIKDVDSFEFTYTSPPSTQSGGFPISLTVKDSTGCSATFVRVIYPSHPKPDFKVYMTPKCDKPEFQFFPAVNGLSPFTFSWEFGDGKISGDQIPTHSFDKDGDYKITLTVQDANGCQDTVSRPLKVVTKFPEAKFIAHPADTTCPPLLVNFEDASTPGFVGIRSWFWDFGDGTSSNLQRPKKLYSLPGKYSVKLTITDSLGCTATIDATSAVTVDGPVGSYKISSLRGCRPFTVTFTATSTDATGFKWDIGNGVIESGNPVTYTYEKAGTFIPALILVREAPDDTCVYALPNPDTIIVDPLPAPDFTYFGECFGYPTYFIDASTSTKGDVTGWEWDFGDGFKATEQNPAHIYKGPGFYNVKLTAISSLGCRDTFVRKIKIGGLNADFGVSSSTGCAGQPLQFTDKTFADTTVVSWIWDFGDGDSSTKQNPVHTFWKKGLYNVRLVAQDFKGCIDTFILTGFLIGDTIPPPSPMVYRVTVENDKTIRLDFERYKDIDHKEYIIYRKAPGGVFTALDTIRNVNDTIYYDSTVDALQNVYCYRVRVRNVCNFFSPLVSPEHCSMELDATPGINKAILNWNSYFGWTNVLKYEIYREYVYSPGTYLLIGTVNGNTNTFTDSNIICYRTHHYKIKAYELGGNKQVSWSDTAATTPVYVPNVPSNEVIRATVENDKQIRIEWTDVPPKIKHKYFILERSLDGISYTRIDTAFVRTDLDFTDTKVKVDELSYYYRMWVVDSCGDLSNNPSNIGKTILLKTDTTADLIPRLTWSRYQGWKEGVQYYDIQLKQADGTWKKIARTLTGMDSTFVDNITNLNSLPEYCYRVIGHRDGPPGNPGANLEITSMSNEDCTPVRSIIYVPNAFSPNRDSINDVFRAKGMYIMEFEMKVFDRWGTMVFHTKNMEEGWDGTFKGQRPLMDSYRWFIQAKGADWQYHFRNGWVTILR
jgi:gliding motility-associated-like protein